LQLNVVILWFKAQPTSPPLDIQLPTTKEEEKLQYDLQLIIIGGAATNDNIIISTLRQNHLTIQVHATR